MTNNRRKTFGSRVADSIVVLISILSLLPLVFTILMSVRPENQPITNGNIFFDCSQYSADRAASDNNLHLLDCTFTLNNYREVWQVAPWPTHYLNSILLVVG